MLIKLVRMARGEILAAKWASVDAYFVDMLCAFLESEVFVTLLAVEFDLVKEFFYESFFCTVN